MPDHINIQHPEAHERYTRHAIEVAELRARIGILENSRQALERELDAIFVRIERGDDVELHYPDRSVIIISRKESADGR